MKQTPTHEQHNPDLLSIIPNYVKNVIEIGCSSGSLAREFKKLYKEVNWIGVEIDDTFATLASRYCDKTIVANIDDCDEKFFNIYSDRDCWIFGDVLEHLKDPWLVLKRIRDVIPAHGVITACIPNAQHWSMIVKLATGEFRYEDSGLLDRTHLRWFTRKTIIELFESQGFKIVQGFPRIFNNPEPNKFLPAIAEIAKICDLDPQAVIDDTFAWQHVVLAVPV
jgi:2-polyprenyl-3-methyl-5-hydroxy-6-metoxy-1,4-benzoquinol methylase